MEEFSCGPLLWCCPLAPLLCWHLRVRRGGVLDELHHGSTHPSDSSSEPVRCRALPYIWVCINTPPCIYIYNTKTPQRISLYGLLVSECVHLNAFASFYIQYSTSLLRRVSGENLLSLFCVMKCHGFHYLHSFGVSKPFSLYGLWCYWQEHEGVAWHAVIKLDRRRRRRKVGHWASGSVKHKWHHSYTTSALLAYTTQRSALQLLPHALVSVPLSHFHWIKYCLCSCVDICTTPHSQL